ncbi:MAG: Holliday junction branch migration protein RuvA, partial [Muribaculaceae bacterium]|nr:Holliday junction branch migration protein RuvA [Muribaculaceae bacterium]
MIDYLSGQLTEITPTSAIVECGGIGYEVNISLIDFTSIQNEKNVKLYIHEAIREDAHLLYGFTSKRG